MVFIKIMIKKLKNVRKKKLNSYNKNKTKNYYLNLKLENPKK